jgi:hypothetical protein
MDHDGVQQREMIMLKMLWIKLSATLSIVCLVDEQEIGTSSILEGWVLLTTIYGYY